jgi:hypothetical protein
MDPSQILAALNEREGLPVEAIVAARAHRDAIVPLVLSDIDRFVVSGESRMGADALFVAFHLLGEWREKAAYRPLARFLRLPDEALAPVLGDAITVTVHRVMAAVFDGDPDPIYGIIHDSNADEFIRSRMVQTVAMLTLNGTLSRPQSTAFLRDCYDALEPRSDNYVWSGWLDALAWLGLAELEPLARQAFARGSIDPSWLTLKDFQRDLQYAVAHPDAPVLHPDGELTAFGDTIAELEHWSGFQPKTESDDLEAWSPSPLSDAPKRNPFRDVGRNDPCPCGSGKKFKKCCLGTDPDVLLDRMALRF